MTTKKLDNTGNFLPFPGFTVVADVYSGNVALFERLHNRLASSIIAEYNSLLPVESYHITQFAVISKKKLNPAQWSTWIKNNMRSMRGLHVALESRTEPFTFRIAGVHGRLLSLEMEVDPAAIQAQFNVAKSFNLEKEIPRKFHCSLGYQYKEFPDKETAAAVEAEFWKIIEEELSATAILQADKPKLCYYESMLQFVPWDGSKVPDSPLFLTKIVGL